MTAAVKIINKVRRGVQNVAYGNPIYQKILASGDTPQRLHFTPSDPWPGDAQAGQNLLSNQQSMFERTESTALRHAATALRNLRAIGTDTARTASVRLIENWLAQYDGWDEVEWMPGHLGSRIAAWIGFNDFYAPAASIDFNTHLVTSLHRQWKHLVRTISPSLTGVEAVQAARGLIYGGLNFPEGDKALGLACDLLQRQMAAELLPDGGHVSRNPAAQLHILRHLVDIRNIFNLADIRLPESIGMGLASMIPALKFFRHGDGALCLFHGGIEETALLVDAVLTQAVVRGRVMHRLTETGYERVMAGRSLLLVDAGSPPPRSVSPSGHAGLLSFEFSHGRERIISNCGAVPYGGAQWHAACAATAAHSTLTVADTNACDVDSEGGIVGHVATTAQRFEEGGAHGIEISHDGYRSQFGLMHHRILRLSGDGETLAGRDILQGAAGRGGGKEFTIRWHLHPGVQASLSQGGQTALLRTPSGGGWRLRVENGTLGLESSIYCGSATPRRTMQVKTSSLTNNGDTVTTWSLTRERKA
ncbi:MAG: heparinase II/III family protein [Alphaproteobacteria bacterium]|nr:heparinase II/III family protein [Alphaproteobacteria bacterium]